MLITNTRAKQIIWHPAGLAGPWGADIAREAAEKMIANVYALASDKERAKALLEPTPT